MNVPDTLRKTQAKLEQAGLAEAARKAQLLLAFVTGCEPAELLFHCLHELSAEQSQRLHHLTAQLLAGQPLQYVLGVVGFMGLDFGVGPGVLIPRPDTEIAVERAIALLQEHPAPLIADICTGSGAIAVSLAHHLAQAMVYGTEISPVALAYARRNAEANNVARRCRLLAGDLCAPLAVTGLRFDLIISNPPYVTTAEMAQLPEEVKQEPPEALLGGPDGLDFYRRLAVEAAALLKPGGYLLLEHGWQQQEQLSTLMEAAGWQILEKLRDYGGRARVLLAEVIS